MAAAQKHDNATEPVLRDECRQIFRTIDDNVEPLNMGQLHVILCTLTGQDEPWDRHRERIQRVWPGILVSEDSLLDPSDFVTLMLALVADLESQSVPTIHTAPEQLQLFAALVAENRSSKREGITSSQLSELLLMSTRGGCTFDADGVNQFLEAMDLQNRSDISFDEFQRLTTGGHQTY